ncbi:hypothetical protein [Branchiibius sp. NY16-3462-2]|uniref:hypothetical protein n=1 Tax=Branchiibius sp. NY16-3462-2 TaxID=1807500 RepID=UPI00079C33A6|nr:hypothetical protein [Branchiibius sp. NY16-3462-2]KYH42984.1 hypothetical protein AZH51_05895 [Branchiibius sp. NY16-3462-2]
MTYPASSRAMLCVVGETESLEYEMERAQLPRWLAWLALAAIVLSLASLVGRWFTQHRISITAIVWIVLGLAGLIYQRFLSRRRVRFRADATAIRRPSVLRDLQWADVDHVLAPSQWSDGAFVMMRNGSTKRTGFPPEYAERLAAIGNKPLK